MLVALMLIVSLVVQEATLLLSAPQLHIAAQEGSLPHKELHRVHLVRLGHMPHLWRPPLVLCALLDLIVISQLLLAVPFVQQAPSLTLKERLPHPSASIVVLVITLPLARRHALHVVRALIKMVAFHPQLSVLYVQLEHILAPVEELISNLVFSATMDTQVQKAPTLSITAINVLLVHIVSMDYASLVIQDTLVMDICLPATHVLS